MSVTQIVHPSSLQDKRTLFLYAYNIMLYSIFRIQQKYMTL